MTELTRAKQLLADASNVAPPAVPDEARIGHFERWDSLAHLRLILALEQQLGRRLDPDEAVGIESIRDVAALLTPRS